MFPCGVPLIQILIFPAPAGGVVIFWPSPFRRPPAVG
jgi:hypothetical protein